MEQYKTNTYRYENIEIVVHRPVLDDKEKMKREASLERALVAYGKETIRRKG